MLSEQPVTEEQTLPDSTYIMDLKTVKSIDESWFLEDGERRKRRGVDNWVDRVSNRSLYLAHFLCLLFLFSTYLAF